ncbi:unnamed protein product [Microthlaspi erraticum]|uniref:F-box associated beta-propeller type 3 domain-containing protein n=1 Tax=Microthlaspi erraticum TaxID=1685480 RepID=A0A6D2JD78_9BRAS|nr:unnamed protein product [Microthlaspi erraticum]
MNGRSMYVLPLPLWENVAGGQLYIVGVAGGTDEVVLWPRSVCAPLYVYYYNMERNTFRRVEIKGMDAVRDYTAHDTRLCRGREAYGTCLGLT